MDLGKPQAALAALALVALALAGVAAGYAYSASGRAGELADRIAALEEGQRQLADTTVEVAESLEAVRQALENLTAAVDSLSGAVEAQSGQAEGLARAVAGLEARLQDLASRLSEVQARLAGVNSTLAERVGNLTADLEELAARLEQLRAAMESGDAAAAEAVAGVREALEELAARLAEIEELLYYPVTVVDATGDQVTLHSRPERIISLSPSVTEILWAVGAGGQVVGVDDYSNYPPEVAEAVENGTLATVGGPWTPSLEAILALQPDLVVGVVSIGAHHEVKDSLARLGIPVVLLPVETLEDVYDSIVTVGLLTGHRLEARELVESIRAQVEETRSLVSSYASNVTVALIVWLEPLWVTGSGTWMHDLIIISGGDNAFSDFEGWTPASLEDLLEANPDVIIATSGQGTLTYEYLVSYLEDNLGEAVYNLTAYATGRIYVIGGEYEDALVRPGPRVWVAVRLLAAILYPEAFNLTLRDLPGNVTPETFPLP